MNSVISYEGAFLYAIHEEKRDRDKDQIRRLIATNTEYISELMVSR